MRRSAEQSLDNLGLEAIDLLQLHVWQDAWLGQGDWLDALEELRAAGKVRHVGVSINDHQADNALAAIEAGIVDTVQVIFNVFDQSPLERLFPACREHDIGVIVRVALDEGGLTGTITADSEFPEDDFRRHYFGNGRAAEVERHVAAICSDLGIESSQMAETALRFVLSEPAVSTVIPGMRSIRHVERNVAVGTAAGCRASSWMRCATTGGAQLLRISAVAAAIPAGRAATPALGAARDFPRDFLGGTAIAAFQTEAGGTPPTPTWAATGGYGATTRTRSRPGT